MITNDAKEEKCCLFCASDYHLEMLIIPYICKKIENEDFFVITQNDLEKSMKLVLDRINIKNELKKKILDIGWNSKETIEKIKEKNKKYNGKISNFIINGDYNYILKNNKEIEEYLENKKVEIINCFHVGDKDVDIGKIGKTYGKIINTIKI